MGLKKRNYTDIIHKNQVKTDKRGLITVSNGINLPRRDNQSKFYQPYQSHYPCYRDYSDHGDYSAYSDLKT